MLVQSQTSGLAYSWLVWSYVTKCLRFGTMSVEAVHLQLPTLGGRYWCKVFAPYVGPFETVPARVVALAARLWTTSLHTPAKVGFNHQNDASRRFGDRG